METFVSSTEYIIGHTKAAELAGWLGQPHKRLKEINLGHVKFV